jgi:nucleotide-binding universal stress UspA family protein
VMGAYGHSRLRDFVLGGNEARAGRSASAHFLSH